MTVPEFLAWDQRPNQLWQLVDGEPQAMAPASVTHGAIQSELARLISNHLFEQKSPCRIIVTPGVIPRVNAETNFRIPDLAVSCAAFGTEDAALTTPVLVIEILSPSNQAETWANVWTYTTIPSVQEILILKSASIGAELLKRHMDGTWPSQPLNVEAGALMLESIGFGLPLAAAYRTAGLGIDQILSHPLIFPEQQRIEKSLSLTQPLRIF